MKNILFRYKKGISLTVIITIVESFLFLLFPLLIGSAINDLINNSLNSLLYLAILGFLVLITGAFRRFFDTRMYAKIYEEMSSDLYVKEKSNGSSVS